MSAIVAFGSGLVVAVQGRVNGELGTVLGSGLLAAAVSFCVGLLLLVGYVAARRQTRDAVRTLRRQVRSGELPWWLLTGGLAGASYVAGQGITIPALGVALFTVATVAGQTGLGLAVDRWGLGPNGQVPLTGLRVLAALVATVAVWVAAGGRTGVSGSATPLLLLALFAGGAVAFQAAFNGRLAAATGQPAVAGLVNFTVGLTVLLLLVVVEGVRADWPGSLAPLAEQPWLLVGGAIGATFVVMAAWSVRGLGVLLFSLLAIAGTLIGAVLADVVVPTSGADVTAHLLLGIGLTGLSVVLAVARRH